MVLVNLHIVWGRSIIRLCHSAGGANVILDIFLLLLSALAKMLVCNRIFLLVNLTSINRSVTLGPGPSLGIFGLCAVRSIFAR